MLQDIQMNWQEVNNRIQQRAQLLQTLEIANESARERAKQFGLTTLDAVKNVQNNVSKMNDSVDSEMKIGSRIGSMNKFEDSQKIKKGHAENVYNDMSHNHILSVETNPIREDSISPMRSCQRPAIQPHL